MYGINKITFKDLCNLEMIDLLSVEAEEDKNELRGFIIKHFEKTNSRIAKKILG